MKKKIAVIMLAVCFLSAPLSAKAMMFDAMPKVNQNSGSQVSRILELLEISIVNQRGELYSAEADAMDNLEQAYAEDDPSAKIAGLLGLLETIGSERSGVIDDIVDFIEEFFGIFGFLSDLLDEDILDILIVIALIVVVWEIIDN